MMLRISFFTLLILLLGNTGLAQEQRVSEAGIAPQERYRQETDDDATKLRIAAAQHEIVAVLFEEGDFEAASVEYFRILGLELGVERENLLVAEAWWVADTLREAGEYNLAHQALDATLAQLQLSENKFSLTMLKGKTYKDQGKLADAVRAYRQAQRYQEEE